MPLNHTLKFDQIPPTNTIFSFTKTSIIIMASSKIFLLLLIHFLFTTTTQALLNHLYHNCSNNTFTKHINFQYDIITSLHSSLASSTTEFSNTTVASGVDTFYGQIMCQGDVTLQMCQQCLDVTAQQSYMDCEFSKEAIIWYEECMLRYSNHSFFSIVQTRPRLCLSSAENVSNKESFMRTILYDTMNKTADKAAQSAVGKKKYATGKANISALQTVYCQAQCTPDLSPEDCRSCLSGVIGDLDWCCHGKQGGRVMYPSCNVRYELYHFYTSDEQLQSSMHTPQVKGKGQLTWTVVIVVVSSVGALGIFLCLASYLLKNLIKKRRNAILRQYFGNESNNLEPLQFSLATIEAATNKFSHENCLGRGGFGQVYKGVLSNVQEIAIKRLSKSSGQGVEEFKNEVLFIAKLQHRNLVALLGFCIEEQEKILIYEYVQNKSLDYFLCDSQVGKVLNWAMRCKIIEGVARGILYLHEYSRLKIIHHDLKPSNILLDDDMNPKISDFGLAKMVDNDTNKASTNRIVGTYGYMSPEYAMYGQFSEKSDVFNFGVIILEIIIGKKNTRCDSQSQYDCLLSYAWRQWKEEKLQETIDLNIEEFESYNEVIKCVQIGLLCVQENPDKTDNG